MSKIAKALDAPVTVDVLKPFLFEGDAFVPAREGKPKTARIPLRIARQLLGQGAVWFDPPAKAAVVVRAAKG